MLTYEFLNPNRYFTTGSCNDDPEDINRLLPQLSDKAPVVDIGRVMFAATWSQLLVVRNENSHIQGMATLTMKRTLFGKVAFIDHVVVDESLRGQNVGEGLMTRLMQRAKVEEYADCIKLTSRPSRIAANKLYQKLGFEQYEPTPTNHYRLTL